MVFLNEDHCTIQEMEETIKAALIDETWFYANKWNLKDLHLYNWDEEIDHNWHEYDFIEEVEEEATNGSIADFILLIKR